MIISLKERIVDTNEDKRSWAPHTQPHTLTAGGALSYWLLTALNKGTSWEWQYDKNDAYIYIYLYTMSFVFISAKMSEGEWVIIIIR